MLDSMVVIVVFVAIELGTLVAAGLIWRKTPVERFKNWANTTIMCAFIAIVMLCAWWQSGFPLSETAFAWSASGLLVLNLCLMLAWWRAWVLAARRKQTPTTTATA